MPLYFCQCWPIFKVLSPRDLAVNSGKAIIKWPITLEMHCYTTVPCKMFVLKNHNDPKLSEVNFHAILSYSQQLLKNIHQMMLASFCSLMKSYLQRPIQKTRTMTDCTHIHQPRRKTSCQNRLCTQITFSHWWHQSASNKWLTLHQLDTCRHWSQA